MPQKPSLSPVTKWLLGTLSLAVIAILSLLFSKPSLDLLRIIFCNVGQGDAILITYQHLQVLVDAGPDREIQNCLSKHLPLSDKNIELLVLTHPQADHLGGLLSVLNHYTVDKFAISPVGNSTQGYQRLTDWLSQHPSVQVVNLYARDQIKLNQRLQLTVIWPSRDWATGHLADHPPLDISETILGATTSVDLNDFSLVLHLNFDDFDTLLTGDADQSIQDDLLATGLVPNQIEVLKIPHHGSRTGLLDEFLNQVSPQLAVISVGKNSYGHPSNQIIQRLETRGIPVLRTDRQGDIVIATNGRSWWVDH